MLLDDCLAVPMQRQLSELALHERAIKREASFQGITDSNDVGSTVDVWLPLISCNIDGGVIYFKTQVHVAGKHDLRPEDSAAGQLRRLLITHNVPTAIKLETPLANFCDFLLDVRPSAEPPADLLSLAPLQNVIAGLRFGTPLVVAPGTVAATRRVKVHATGDVVKISCEANQTLRGRV